jgi:hypothetical protein
MSALDLQQKGWETRARPCDPPLQPFEFLIPRIWYNKDINAEEVGEDTSKDMQG